MPLNVLLVDDEYIVLKGLEIILKEQSEVELKLVTALDAAEAFMILDSFRPDVVIADINMPETNGFEMIIQIRERFPRCKFIICSGYDEHSYLKQALQLHVADYLMKPVDKTILIQRLRELAHEKESLTAHTLLRIQLLLFKAKIGSETDFSMNDLKAMFPESSFCLCAVNISGFAPEEITKKLAHYFDIIYPLTLNSRIIYLINYTKRISSDSVRSILHSILNPYLWECSFFSSESGIMSAIRQIPVYYQEALGKMVFSVLAKEHDTTEDILTCLSERTLFPAIRVVTFEDNIEDYIQELYASVPKDICYALAFTEIFSAYLLVSDISLPTDLIRQLYPPQNPSNCSKKSLVHYVKKILNFWYDSFSPTEHANCSSKIASACRYIDLHYQEDLSLDQIAEILSMNASYLSYIFKKETGSTLVQYLTNIRINHACELLRSHPELSLDEIALQTGYNSTTYFHKIFRSRFGVSPRQWQISHTSNAEQ